MKNKDTLFKKGQPSPNPQGRPKGSGLSGKIRKAIESEQQEILQAVIDKAKSGDISAAKILLDRVCPSLKPETQQVALPQLSHGSLTERATEVLNAVASGQLSPDAASQLISSISTLAKVVEMDEVINRLNSLEQKVYDDGSNQW
jgi:thioredoxin-like negative regulator of GroEL